MDYVSDKVNFNIGNHFWKKMVTEGPALSDEEFFNITIGQTSDGCATSVTAQLEEELYGMLETSYS